MPGKNISTPTFFLFFRLCQPIVLIFVEFRYPTRTGTDVFDQVPDQNWPVPRLQEALLLQQWLSKMLSNKQKVIGSQAP